ncbi:MULTISPECIES: hypothetical protein [Actinosynnema]|uniref:Polysaccharide deacetylase n=1 Tax=Actinosynnema pretiosum TaxID=42197 RepID=A0A290Z9W2_9PSEU|nr:hypothetical protein [Actinosynnema pretiosum]ATE55759.1 hypothetical protein CNX65_22790 [Actinosynnema pretiosum]
MSETCSYHHSHLKEALELALARGYSFRTCAQYAEGDRGDGGLLAVMRHDVDLLPERVPPIARIEADLGIRATYFFRVHANEYNALGHQTVAIMRDVLALGHEVGLHAEPLDLLASTGVEPAVAIRASVTALEAVLGVPITGIASHNDITPDNNLDYFRRTGAAELGLKYEAYDESGLDLFGKSWYITDGHFWYWRAFQDGELTDNRQCLCEHFAAERTPIYSLVHPHVWFEHHFQRVHH